MSEQDTGEEKGSPFAPAEGEPLPPQHRRTVRLICYAEPDEYTSVRSWLADLDESPDWFDQQQQVVSRTTHLQVGDERVELSELLGKEVSDLRRAVDEYDQDDLAVVTSNEVADEYVLDVQHDGMAHLTALVSELLPENVEVPHDDDVVGLTIDDEFHGLFDPSGERVLQVQAHEPAILQPLLPVAERTTPEVFRFSEVEYGDRHDVTAPERPGFVVEVFIGWTTSEVLTELTEAVAIPLRDKLAEIDAIDTVRLDYVQSITRTEDA